MKKKNIVRSKAVVNAILVLLILPVCIWAQLSTSKNEGVVSDKDTGSPLAGVQIVVEGTRLGNVPDSDRRAHRRHQADTIVGSSPVCSA